MKKLILNLALAAALGGSTFAQDVKHPGDKCPPGTHTEKVTERTVIHGDLPGVGGEHEVTRERVVCRENGHDVKDKP